LVEECSSERDTTMTEGEVVQAARLVREYHVLDEFRQKTKRDIAASQEQVVEDDAALAAIREKLAALGVIM
jgi:hypothetical protein